MMESFLEPFRAVLNSYSFFEIASLFIITFTASYVRAFAGFGGAMIAVPAFLHILPLDKAVVLSMSLDVLVGFALLPPVLRAPLHWNSIRILTIASLLAIPLGAWGVHVIPIKLVYGLIGATVFLATLALACGYRAKENPTKSKTILAGFLSGLLGGALGMSGPPVILLYFSSPMGQHMGRASMMMYFFIIIFPIIFFRAGFSQIENIVPLFFLIAPIALFAVFLGHNHFLKTNEKIFRRVVYALLFGLALSSAMKAVV